MKKEDLVTGAKYTNGDIFVFYFGLDRRTEGNPMLLKCQKDEIKPDRLIYSNPLIISDISMYEFLESFQPCNKEDNGEENTNEEIEKVAYMFKKRYFPMSLTQPDGNLFGQNKADTENFKKEFYKVTHEAVRDDDYELLIELRNIFNQAIDNVKLPKIG